MRRSVIPSMSLEAFRNRFVSKESLESESASAGEDRDADEGLDTDDLDAEETP